jgi:uncharacterized membrane protein
MQMITSGGDRQAAQRQRTPWAITVTTTVLILIVLGFAVRRTWFDVSHLLAGNVPDDPYDAKYVSHPWLTYLHIVPGVLYFAGAALQLSFWFRRRHYPAHRRVGRVVLVAGLLAGVTAMVLGVIMPFGGRLELTATAVFGAWFLTCLLLALRAIRSGDLPAHRRWMIRAFVIAIGVGTIRVCIALFTLSGLLDLSGAFGPSFWIAFVVNAVAGELWLRARPVPPEG